MDKRNKSKGKEGQEEGQNLDLTKENAGPIKLVGSIKDELDAASSPLSITCFAGNERKGSCFAKDHENF